MYYGLEPQSALFGNSRIFRAWQETISSKVVPRHCYKCPHLGLVSSPLACFYTCSVSVILTIEPNAMNLYNYKIQPFSPYKVICLRYFILGLNSWLKHSQVENDYFLHFYLLKKNVYIIKAYPICIIFWGAKADNVNIFEKQTANSMSINTNSDFSSY